MIALAETFSISSETDADMAARDALLDRAMGANWRRKSSEKLRRGRLPAVALIARDRSGAVVG
ncbi:MAG: GNAT family N-acetyltransferase, partial [Rhizobiaceae bacterium]